jgi:hypothetical protein
MDVAVLVGAAREGTNRSLVELKREGKVAVVDHRLLVRGHHVTKARTPAS